MLDYIAHKYDGVPRGVIQFIHVPQVGDDAMPDSEFYAYWAIIHSHGTGAKQVRYQAVPATYVQAGPLLYPVPAERRMMRVGIVSSLPLLPMVGALFLGTCRRS